MRPFGDVGAVDFAELGESGKGFVAAANGVDEHLDIGADDLLDVSAGLIRRDRRFEGDECRRVAVGIEDQSGRFGRLLESPRLLIPMLLFRAASGMGDPYSLALRAGDLPAGVSKRSIRSKPAYTKFKQASPARSILL